jgi:hypothetical protein
MGSWYQVIADLEATEDEAEALGAWVLDWLVTTGVVVAEPTDCVLGGVEHAPGPNYTTALDGPDELLLTLRANGVEIITGRTIFYSMGTERITCPRCGYAVGPDGRDLPTDPAWTELTDRFFEWLEGGSGDLPCPGCKRLLGLNDWEWSPPWAFGNLGVRFWNWNPLTPAFVAEVSKLLGHKVVCPNGKV